MSDYTFLTQWHFDAPLADVWDLLYHPVNWPGWWKAVVAVEEVASGDARGIGSIKRFTWRGALPYKLTFNMETTELKHHRIIAGKASGELEGTGRWTLAEAEDGTQVTYVWQVNANKAWMRWLAPVARPAFRWNHDLVMRWGEEGMRRQLRFNKLTNTGV